MYLERKEDLSVIYLVKDILAAGPGIAINVEDGFPTDTITLPTVSVDAGKLLLEPFELGNRSGRRIRRWYIDVFAKNKSMRDELGYKILNGLDNGVLVYDYDLGFPPLVVPSIEHLDIVSRQMDFKRPIPELIDTLYYRATITIVATNDTV